MLLYVRRIVVASRGSPTLLKNCGSINSHECRIGIFIFLAVTHFGAGELLSFMNRRAKVYNSWNLYSRSRDVAKSIRSGGLDRIRLASGNPWQAELMKNTIQGF